MNSATLVTAMASLSRRATDDFTVAEMLAALCDAATATLRIDGAAVMLQETDRTVFVHAVGDPHIAPLEALQEALQSGPCAHALTQGVTVVATDLSSDPRWVEFQALSAQLHIRGMASVPLLSRGRSWGVLDLFRVKPGEWTAQDLEAAHVLADVAVSYVVMAHDRDLARRAQQALAHRTLHDDLTGLANRALLFDRLDRALSNAGRRAGGVAVLFLDLDSFKDVNDTFGHTVADQVLIGVADRLRRSVRSSDTVARFAGDEFVIVCEGLGPSNPGAPDGLVERTSALTTRLQKTLQAPIRIGAIDVVVSASIGVAITTDPLTAQDLLADADTAMYAAKQRGRGRTSVRNHVTLSAIGYARQLERDLAGALERDELELYYQPIVDATTRKVAAVEALLRWNRPAREVLPAAAFIDIALRTGLIVSIGRWVITQACTQLAAWRRDLGGVAPASVYVNLSARELADPQLLDTIDAALATTRLAPTDLGLEIVEEDLTDPFATAALQQLQQRGHDLSIDDFGTGYSSLSRLLDLPAAIAKVDRSIVAGIPEDARRLRFIDGVLHMAATLDVRVIAEGVETAQQADHLTRAGCHLLQGHYIGAPQPAVDLTIAWTR